MYVYLVVYTYVNWREWVYVYPLGVHICKLKGVGVRIPFGVHTCKLKGMGVRIPFGVHISKFGVHICRL